ncbi:hypothetical protein BC832DRAFT_543789 [Gaertneriomyces semiglobifer]|nr:hypothetical protein BC832DRAFT_543789 [Gaertneriomyces semiglobifer]
MLVYHYVLAYRIVYILRLGLSVSCARLAWNAALYVKSATSRDQVCAHAEVFLLRQEKLAIGRKRIL